MKKYEEMPDIVKKMIETAVSEDSYGLRPETLYKNIVGSLRGTPDYKVAEIMNVPIVLVDMINFI